MSNQRDMLQRDVFDVLSATWVFACNDENPIITYRGIQQRLGLDDSIDIKRLVQTRGELFRRGVPRNRLVAWKADMGQNKHLPNWIRDLPPGPAREKAIADLTIDDVFRSQFRAEEGSPRSSLEVIDWGLQHIERLRKANSEARQGTATRWQMWLVFSIGILNICATVGVALLKKS